MGFPKGKELVRIFLEDVHKYPDFVITSESNPLRLLFNGRAFMLYFKCISYAGSPYPLNTTRAQLPYKEEFKSLEDSEVFLFLGYDVDNDLYICWDPVKTRSRLNQKSYVSFFCRKSLQDSVAEGEIKKGLLSNGDSYVLFKRPNIRSFFEMLDHNFSGLKLSPGQSKSSDEKIEATEPREIILDEIETDSSVQLMIDQLASQGQSKLPIIAACMNSFGSYYNKMTFIDWAKIVERYLDKLNHTGLNG